LTSDARWPDANDPERYGWTVGRTRISPTSTDAGWAMTKAIVSATVFGGVAVGEVARFQRRVDGHARDAG
jgi:hypothetical protein